jgi:small neutral amino acid transporter SnatA (MarC family)
VALTQNYLSASYLSSGCRDRAETVPPEALGSQSLSMVTMVAATVAAMVAAAVVVVMTVAAAMTVTVYGPLVDTFLVRSCSEVLTKIMNVIVSVED